LRGSPRTVVCKRRTRLALRGLDVPLGPPAGARGSAWVCRPKQVRIGAMNGTAKIAAMILSRREAAGRER